MRRQRTGHRGTLLAALAIGVGIVLTVSLGQWQMRRADEKRALQAAWDAAQAQPPVALDAGLVAEPWVGRRVTVTGTFDEAHTVFLDNRTHQGVAGFFVLTPLRPAAAAGSGNRGDGAARSVLVLRGWIARDPVERTRLPVVPSLIGPVRVEGVVMAELPQPLLLGGAASPVAEVGGRLLQHFDASAYRAWSGLDVVPQVLRQTAPLADGLVRDWVAPGPGVVKHQAYAVQWYSMAAGLSGFAVFALWRRRRRPGVC